MKLGALLNRRESPGEAAPADEVVSEPERGMQWTGGPVIATRALTALLWVVVAIGPAYAVYDVVTDSDAPPAVTEDGPVAADPAGEVAGEYGRQVVLAWLTATRTNSEQVLAVLPEVRPGQLPETAPRVRDVAVAAIVVGESARDAWTVTVGYDVGLGVDDSDTVAWSRQYAQVVIEVRWTDTGYSVAALTLPSVVNGPGTSAPELTLAYSTQLGSDDPLLVTAQQFLEAYLTGQGDITRVLTPGAQIIAITPAPYTEVTGVTGLSATDVPADPSDGASVQVLISAWVARADGTSVQVQYPLELSARSDRWEVTSIQSTPAVVLDDDSTSTTN